MDIGAALSQPSHVNPRPSLYFTMRVGPSLLCCTLYFLTLALRCLALSFTELLHGLVAPSELVSAVESYCVDGWWKLVLQESEGQFE